MSWRATTGSTIGVSLLTQRMSVSLEAVRPATVLVAIQLPHQTEDEVRSSIAELARLCDTLGFDVVDTLVQRRPKLHRAAGLGGGKLKELAAMTGGPGVIPSMVEKKKQKKDLHAPATESLDFDDDDDDDVDDDDAAKEPPKRKATLVVVDNELSPSQLRNLSLASGTEVLDRASVIIEIFARHARTKEAQMQVEIARLQYEAPRLREKQQVGNSADDIRKGESAAELDRRKIRDRIAELREQLELAQQEADRRRERRGDSSRVALVGYTNAGKSSLMRALTGSEVLVADKLFATLGTTVRALPGSTPRILVSDTVGFIKNLPHALVASFKSTLDEANEASLLLIVVDCSDEAWPAQLQVTTDVLGELGAGDIPRWLVFNKIDRADALTRAGLRAKHPDALQVSALSSDDVKELQQRIRDHFSEQLEEASFLVAFARGGAASALAHERLQVMSEEWTEDGLRLVVRGPPDELVRLRSVVGDD
jgi:GTPase